MNTLLIVIIIVVGAFAPIIFLFRNKIKNFWKFGIDLYRTFSQKKKGAPSIKTRFKNWIQGKTLGALALKFVLTVLIVAVILTPVVSVFTGNINGSMFLEIIGISSLMTLATIDLFLFANHKNDEKNVWKKLWHNTLRKQVYVIVLIITMSIAANLLGYSWWHALYAFQRGPGFLFILVHLLFITGALVAINTNKDHGLRKIGYVCTIIGLIILITTWVKMGPAVGAPFSSPKRSVVEAAGFAPERITKIFIPKGQWSQPIPLRSIRSVDGVTGRKVRLDSDKVIDWGPGNMKVPPATRSVELMSTDTDFYATVLLPPSQEF